MEDILLWKVGYSNYASNMRIYVNLLGIVFCLVHAIVVIDSTDSDSSCGLILSSLLTVSFPKLLLSRENLLAISATIL